MSKRHGTDDDCGGKNGVRQFCYHARSGHCFFLKFDNSPLGVNQAGQQLFKWAADSRVRLTRAEAQDAFSAICGHKAGAI